MTGRRRREALIRRWEDRQASRPDDRLPLRVFVGFLISMATVAVLLGVVLPAVGWLWTSAVIIGYAASSLLMSGLPEPPTGRRLGHE